MKKILCFLLAITMLGLFTGCDKGGGDPAEETNPNEVSFSYTETSSGEGSGTINVSTKFTADPVTSSAAVDMVMEMSASAPNLQMSMKSNNKESFTAEGGKITGYKLNRTTNVNMNITYNMGEGSISTAAKSNMAEIGTGIYTYNNGELDYADITIKVTGTDYSKSTITPIGKEAIVTESSIDINQDYKIVVDYETTNGKISKKTVKINDVDKNESTYEYGENGKLSTITTNELNSFNTETISLLYVGDKITEVKTITTENGESSSDTVKIVYSNGKPKYIEMDNQEMSFKVPLKGSIENIYKFFYFGEIYSIDFVAEEQQESIEIGDTITGLKVIDTSNIYNVIKRAKAIKR